MPCAFSTPKGRCGPDHYCLPPLARWDLDEILASIDQKNCFLLHAPRQTGKTTCLLALMDYLNRAECHQALYANIEAAQTARKDSEAGMATVCSALGRSARLYLQGGRLVDWCWETGATVPAGDRLTQRLEFRAAAEPLPAALLA
jgi:hypothetical protein